MGLVRGMEEGSELLAIVAFTTFTKFTTVTEVAALSFNPLDFKNDETFFYK